jgi:hypothetical protein
MGNRKDQTMRYQRDYAVYYTAKSSNGKIGAIPVSTISKETCPEACPLKGNGCYADGGPLSIIWNALSERTPGMVWTNGVGGKLQSLTWNRYCYEIAQLPAGQEWRHGQAGDLPGVGDTIDARALSKLVKANRGKRGFAYTHKPVLNNPANAAAVAHANANGFTINLSANDVTEVDALVALDIAPVVVVLPADVHGKQDISTAGGTRIVVCPATYRDDIKCVDCMLCQKQRKCAVGFPAHGASKRRASNVASRVTFTRNAA